MGVLQSHKILLFRSPQAVLRPSRNRPPRCSAYTGKNFLLQAGTRNSQGPLPSITWVTLLCQPLLFTSSPASCRAPKGPDPASCLHTCTEWSRPPASESLIEIQRVKNPMTGPRSAVAPVFWRVICFDLLTFVPSALSPPSLVHGSMQCQENKNIHHSLVGRLWDLTVVVQRLCMLWKRILLFWRRACMRASVMRGWNPHSLKNAKTVGQR